MIHLADASLAGAAVVRSGWLRQLQLSASQSESGSKTQMTQMTQTTKSLVEGVRRVGRVGRESTVRSKKRIHYDPLWSTDTDKLPDSACTSGRLKSSHPASFKLASDQITWRMTYMMNPSQMLRIIVSLQWLCQLRTFTPLQIQEHFGFHSYYGKLRSYFSLQSNNHCS